MMIRNNIDFERMLNSTNTMIRIFETGCFLESYFGVNAPGVRDFDLLDEIVNSGLNKDNYLDAVLCTVHGLLEKKPLEYGNEAWSFAYGTNCLNQIIKDFSKDCGTGFGELIKECSKSDMNEESFINKCRKLIGDIAFTSR